MALGLELYPPSLKSVPRGLTRPTLAYRVLVVVALLALFLFLAFYLALVAGAGYLVYLAATYPMGLTPTSGRAAFYALLVKAGSIAAAVMILLFLVKGLLKRFEFDDSLYLEIREKDQPELYAFIRRLCRELRAPFPHRIFLSPDVNAGVFYNRSLLSLLFPTRKNLVIGLGLVNVLNVNEFKAVLAHEFGHFSQSSMALGQYAARASEAVADLVFGRDQWDDWLAQWCEQDIRIAIFGWAVAAAVWVLRQMLIWSFSLVQLAVAALRRQEEFHADLVAASVTGSDALVHALIRSRFASLAMEVAIQDLSLLAEQGHFSRDLFVHQIHAGRYLRRLLHQPDLGNPPPLPENPNFSPPVFNPGPHDRTSLWDCHPALWQRERNLKRRYLRSLIDHRPAWRLFRHVPTLRATVTSLCYDVNLQCGRELTFADPEKVQALIDREHQHPGHHEAVHGLRPLPAHPGAHELPAFQ